MNSFESKFKRPMWFLAVALSALMVGCGGDDDDAAPAPPPPVDDPVGAVCTQGAACVPLATAGNYVILARDGGITSDVTSPSVVTGNVGMNAAATGITGFSLVADASNTFATSAQVIGGGRVYASDYAAPTPANLTQAVTDTGAAFTDVDSAISHPVGVGNTDVGTPIGNITGMDLAPGVYEWTAASVVIDAPGVTLTGGPTAVWIFRTPGGMTMNSGATVTLAGGALPQNVFWRSAGVVALNTTANLKGIVLSGSSVTMANGATVNGRLIATTAVTLIGNTVTRPAP